MKIKSSELFNVEMSYQELITITKLLGETNGEFKVKAGLTEEQKELVSEIYDYLDDYFGKIK